MMWTIPGTLLQADRKDAQQIPQQMEALFFGGGITLSQVTSITGLEAHTVQNWVKRGFLTNPKGKRYTLRQLCRIININMLRGSMPLDRICQLLSFVNGDLSDEGDDMIDDSQLYFMFVRLAAQLKELRDYESAAKLLDTYCAWLKTYCRAFRIPTVDFREDFLDAQCNARRELFCDGLHPNAQGHRLMAKKIGEKL